MLVTTLSVFVLTVSRLVLGQNFTASTCTSQSGYNSCMSPASKDYQNCVAASGGDQNKILACGCVFQLNQLNCVMENCWNTVYGCEYQALAIDFINECSIVDIPFFPAPDNAPAGCSCNLGHVFYNASNALFDTNSCLSIDIARNEGCTCCEQSGILTSILSICPNVDSDYLPGLEIYETVVQLGDPPFAQCGSDFSKYNCVNDLGFPAIGNIPYLSSLPATTGTLSISTTSGSLTAPPSGATFSWTALGEVFTIVGVNAGKGAASSSKSSSAKTSSTAAPGSVSTSASSAGTVTGTTSSSAAAASATHSSGAAESQIFLASGLFCTLLVTLWNI